MRESIVEKKVTEYAKKYGWLPFKFTGQKSVPDHLYIKNGDTIYVEYKSKGKKPRPLQEFTFNKMREHGARVFVIDSIEAGRRLFDVIS